MIRASIFPWRLFELIQKELVTTFATERYFLPRVGRSITTFNIQGGKNLRDETQKTSVYTVAPLGWGGCQQVVEDNIEILRVVSGYRNFRDVFESR